MRRTRGERETVEEAGREAGEARSTETWLMSPYVLTTFRRNFHLLLSSSKSSSSNTTLDDLQPALELHLQLLRVTRMCRDGAD